MTADKNKKPADKPVVKVRKGDVTTVHHTAGCTLCGRTDSHRHDPEKWLNHIGVFTEKA